MSWLRNRILINTKGEWKLSFKCIIHPIYTNLWDMWYVRNIISLRLHLYQTRGIQRVTVVKMKEYQGLRRRKQWQENNCLKERQALRIKILVFSVKRKLPSITSPRFLITLQKVRETSLSIRFIAHSTLRHLFLLLNVLRAPRIKIHAISRKLQEL